MDQTQGTSHRKRLARPRGVCQVQEESDRLRAVCRELASLPYDSAHVRRIFCRSTRLRLHMPRRLSLVARLKHERTCMSCAATGAKLPRRPRSGMTGQSLSELSSRASRIELMYRELRRRAPNGIAQREVDEVMRRLK